MYGNLIINFRDAIRKSFDDHLRFQHSFSDIKEWWDFLNQSLKNKYLSIFLEENARMPAERESVDK